MHVSRTPEDAYQHTGIENTGRRTFLAQTLGVTAGLVGAAATAEAYAVPASAKEPSVQADQDNWQFCGKCFGLFYRGFESTGRCPAGSGHSAFGFNFLLPYNMPPTPNAQDNWQFCEKCFGMFYSGSSSSNGSCPAGNGHNALGFNFVLPYGVPPTPNHQDKWRFCRYCSGMFFWGFPSNGRCPAARTHSAQGFNFVLPHKGWIWI
jgi:uncharacterized membrane protein